MPTLTPAEISRFHLKFDQGEGCWEWSAEAGANTYGYFTIYRKGRVRLLAHRVSYFLATGVDPVGLVVRHRCDNPPCVNPAHLLVGTQADNVQDAISRRRANLDGLALGRLERASCRRGHPFTDDNVYVAPSGQRVCKACRRIHTRAYKDRLSAPERRKLRMGRAA